MAKAVDIAASAVVKIWHDHGLAPHRWRKLSNGKAFAEWPHDVVGLNVLPRAHAIALSVNEKSQIQALDRALPRLTSCSGLTPSRALSQTDTPSPSTQSSTFRPPSTNHKSTIRNLARLHGAQIRMLNSIIAA
jgi:hypothetical protein